MATAHNQSITRVTSGREVSSKRGQHGKKRTGGQKTGQKYQNTDGYKRDKWGTNERHFRIQEIPIGAVCGRCREKIEWRKKFDKYKPLKAPSRCDKCNEKAIKHAYHKVCLPCSSKLKICAMCRKEGEQKPMPLTAAEEQAEILAAQEMVNAMSERKRRTYLRKLAEANATSSEDEDEDGEAGASGGGDGADGGGAAAAAAEEGRTEGEAAAGGGGGNDEEEAARQEEVARDMAARELQELQETGGAAAAAAAAAHGGGLDWEAELSDGDE